MGHDHPHSHHDHSHHDHSHHDYDVPAGGDLPAALDLSTPDAELTPADRGRRAFLRRAGLLGAGAATASVLAGAGPGDAQRAEASQGSGGGAGGLRWLAGDHHIHTQYTGLDNGHDTVTAAEDRLRDLASGPPRLWDRLAPLAL